MKIRIRFSKEGSMKFIGHLDVMRYFQKCFRRAGIPVKLSEGFSPHFIMSFASPLGIGLTTCGDYLDVTLKSDENTEDVKARLNAVLNEEIRVISVLALPEDEKTSMSMLAACDYVAYVKDEKIQGFAGPTGSALEEKISEFMNSSEIKVLKKTKKSEKEVNIRDNIYIMRPFDTKSSKESGFSEFSEKKMFDAIFMRVTSGSVTNIKPELVIESFADFCGFKYDPFDWQITRLDMYGDRNAVKGKVNTMTTDPACDLVSLSEYV